MITGWQSSPLVNMLKKAHTLVTIMLTISVFIKDEKVAKETYRGHMTCQQCLSRRINHLESVATF